MEGHLEEKINQEESNVCPECGHYLVTGKHGEIFCPECGLVTTQQPIDLGPDWRCYGPEHARRVRAGYPTTPTMHDGGLGSLVGKDGEFTDGYGKPVSPEMAANLKRLRRWQTWSRAKNSRDIKIISALQDLNRYVSKLKIPKDIHKQIATLYVKAVNEGCAVGRGHDPILIACIYYICRENQIPYSLKDLASELGISAKKIGGAFKEVVRKLGRTPPQYNHLVFINKYCDQLKLSAEAREKAFEILNALPHPYIDSKQPLTIAAAVVYYTSQILDEKRTQEECAELAKVTQVSIRLRYKEIREFYEASKTQSF